MTNNNIRNSNYGKNGNDNDNRNKIINNNSNDSIVPQLPKINNNVNNTNIPSNIPNIPNITNVSPSKSQGDAKNPIVVSTPENKDKDKDKDKTKTKSKSKSKEKKHHKSSRSKSKRHHKKKKSHHKRRRSESSSPSMSLSESPPPPAPLAGKHRMDSFTSIQPPELSPFLSPSPNSMTNVSTPNSTVDLTSSHDGKRHKDREKKRSKRKRKEREKEEKKEKKQKEKERRRRKREKEKEKEEKKKKKKEHDLNKAHGKIFDFVTAEFRKYSEKWKGESSKYKSTIKKCHDRVAVRFKEKMKKYNPQTAKQFLDASRNKTYIEKLVIKYVQQRERQVGSKQARKNHNIADEALVDVDVKNEKDKDNEIKKDRDTKPVIADVTTETATPDGKSKENVKIEMAGSKNSDGAENKNIDENRIKDEENKKDIAAD